MSEDLRGEVDGSRARQERVLGEDYGLVHRASDAESTYVVGLFAEERVFPDEAEGKHVNIMQVENDVGKYLDNYRFTVIVCKLKLTGKKILQNIFITFPRS